MNHLIECPHPLKTTDLRHSHQRLHTPRPGDVVDFLLLLGQYPASKRYGTICHVRENSIGFYCEPGSVFINETGVDISGGPFASCKPCDLIPAFSLHTLGTHTPMMKNQRFWNWGNNGAGAANGVDFIVSRPVFFITSIRGYETEYSFIHDESCGVTLADWQRTAEEIRQHITA